MKPSHIIARVQIIIADAYARLLTHAKEQIGINQPEHPIELGLPVLSNAVWRVFRDGELVREFDQVEAATAYIRVQKIWVVDSDTRFEIKKVESC